MGGNCANLEIVNIHTSTLFLIKTQASEVFNPIALRKAKIVYNFGLSECNRVNEGLQLVSGGSVFMGKYEKISLSSHHHFKWSYN